MQIPEQLLPNDGRFGSGPSLIRQQQLDDLVARGRTLLGTSHRQAPVKHLVAQLRGGLSDLFQLPEGYEVLISNGGSTAFWDAAAFGIVRERAQTAVFGEFGGKFAQAASAPWLTAPDVREAEPGSVALLEAADGIDLYATPQNETSTGAMVPVRRVASPDALTMIDATSSAGGVEVDLRECDVYYFAPQKNFGADGGLWVALVSPAALERIAQIAASDRYIPEFLRLDTVVSNSRKEQTYNTPAIATLSLFESQVRWMNELGGLGAIAARTRESSQALYDWAERTEWVTPFVADPAYRSTVVVTLDLAPEIDGKQVSALLRENGIVDIDPYRKLGRNQLRIGTFAAVEPDDVRALINCLEYVVERL